MPTKPTGRPRGRPKGSKNLPPLEELLSVTPEVPPRREKAKARGPWAGMSPEERSAYAKALRAKSPPGFDKDSRRKKGVPEALTSAQWAEHVATQTPIINRIIKKMSDKGILPDDPMAVEALKSGVTVLRTAQDDKTKLAAARLILEWTKAKPTSKVEHTIKSAEDILDEMAEDDTP